MFNLKIIVEFLSGYFKRLTFYPAVTVFFKLMFFYFSAIEQQWCSRVLIP